MYLLDHFEFDLNTPYFVVTCQNYVYYVIYLLTYEYVYTYVFIATQSVKVGCSNHVI